MDLNIISEYFNKYLEYNSPVILTYFLICLTSQIINKLTDGKANKKIFSTERASIFNPLTYIRLFTHAIGHDNWNHLKNNFLYILLVGPMIEEKYGSINLLKMILITAAITGIINFIIGKKRILGASGISFMLILLSSLVNFKAGRIPLTFVLICIFYLVGEVKDGLFKKDNISHLSHILGAICGFIYGFYIFK